MHHWDGNLSTASRTMTTLGHNIYWLIAAFLLLSGQNSLAEGLTGDIQVVSVPSKDKSVQRSITEVSVYLEYEMTSAVSVFAVGYHDQEFRSETIGLARKYGKWQLGLGVGHAAFDDMNHLVINPWAFYSDEDYKGYLHYESYRNDSTHSHYMKGYALKHLGRFLIGAHAQMDFGLGPRIEVKLVDGIRLWGVIPVARRPKEGAMKGMIGVTSEF